MVPRVIYTFVFLLGIITAFCIFVLPPPLTLCLPACLLDPAMEWTGLLQQPSTIGSAVSSFSLRVVSLG